MLKTSVSVLIAACLLGACGQSAQISPPAAEAAAAAAPIVTDVACARSYDEPSPMPAVVDVFADSDNDPVAATGVLIQAPAGAATCAGSLADGVTCQVRGPAIVRVAIQDFEFFTVPAGRTATLTQSASTTCFLNAQ